jgi:hypothetical protein
LPILPPSFRTESDCFEIDTVLSSSEGNQVVSLRTLDVRNPLNVEEHPNDAKLRLLKLVAKKVQLGKAEGKNYVVIDETLTTRVPAATGLVLAS